MAAALCAGIPAAGAAQSPPPGARLGYLNGPAVLQAAPCYSWADSIWRGVADGYNHDLSRLQSHLDSAAARYEHDAPLLTGTARAPRIQQLQRMQDSARKEAVDVQDGLRQQQSHWFDAIEGRVASIVDSVREERGLDFVLNIVQLGAAVVSVRKSLDVTPRVTARLALHMVDDSVCRRLPGGH